MCYDAVRKGLSGPYSHQHPVPPVDGQLTNIGALQMLSATSPLQQMHRNKHDADWTRAATMPTTAWCVARVCHACACVRVRVYVLRVFDTFWRARAARAWMDG